MANKEDLSKKYEGIDVSKLKFKKEYKEAGKITIRIEKLNRHHPVSLDVLRDTIGAGNYLEKIQSLFTQASIKEALKGAKKSTEKDSDK